jgi:hypothetical protein
MYNEDNDFTNNLCDTLRMFNSSTKLYQRADKAVYKFLIYQQMDKINKAIKQLQSLVNSYEYADGMDDINELPGFCDNYPFKHSLDEMGTDWGDMSEEATKEYNGKQFTELKQRRRALGDKKYLPDDNKEVSSDD